jgi:hypothetical protein
LSTRSHKSAFPCSGVISFLATFLSSSASLVLNILLLSNLLVKLTPNNHHATVASHGANQDNQIAVHASIISVLGNHVFCSKACNIFQGMVVALALNLSHIVFST